jgi:hypothetical protein
MALQRYCLPVRHLVSTEMTPKRFREDEDANIIDELEHRFDSACHDMHQSFHNALEDLRERRREAHKWTDSITIAPLHFRVAQYATNRRYDRHRQPRQIELSEATILESYQSPQPDAERDEYVFIL